MELVAAKKIVQHKCARPMLHARTLGFRHPVTGSGLRRPLTARSNRLSAAASKPQTTNF